MTVTRRLLIDDFRRRWARPVEVGEADMASAVTQQDESVMIVAVEALRDAAARLSDVYREVLFEIFLEDRSVIEVADRLPISS